MRILSVLLLTLIAARSSTAQPPGGFFFKNGKQIPIEVGSPADAVLQDPVIVRVPIADTPRSAWPTGRLTAEFIVRFDLGVPMDRINAINARNQVVIARRDRFVDRQFILRPLNGQPERALQLANLYHGLEEVDGLAHPNFLVEHRARFDGSEDPLAAQQWHLDGPGGIGVLEAWSLTEGSSGIVIAVIDPHGVEIGHPDLVGALHRNPEEVAANDIDDDGNGLIDDVHGWNFLMDLADPTPTYGDHYHGTAIAGLAVAPKNGLGIVGVAPSCRLLSIRTGESNQDDADAIRYAASQGASVIVCGWGYETGWPTTQVVDDAIADVASKGRDGKGCVVVFAMTNLNVDNFAGPYPDISAHPDVIAVGRSTDNGKWGKSGFGKGMGLLAPSGAAGSTATVECDDLIGERNITTTDLQGIDGECTGMPYEKCPCRNSQLDSKNADYTRCFGGTSAAAPIVAGVAALVLSEYPGATRGEVRDILFGTAERIDAVDADYQEVDGLLYSATHGHGRVAAGAALMEAAERAREAASALPEPEPAEREEDPPGEPGTDSDADTDENARPPGRIIVESHAGEKRRRPAVELVGAAPREGSSRHRRTVVGRSAAEVGLERPFCVLLGVRALVLEGDAKAGGSFVPGAALRVVGEPWARGFRNRGAVIVEPANGLWESVAVDVAALLESGRIRAVGRVGFFDADRLGSAAILLPELRVGRPPGFPLDLLDGLARRHGMEVEARGGEAVLRFWDRETDALRALGVRDELAADERVLLNVRPVWITPIALRPVR